MELHPIAESDRTSVRSYRSLTDQIAGIIGLVRVSPSGGFHNMTEQSESNPDARTDARTDGQRFADTVRAVLTAPKKAVDESIRREREERKAKKTAAQTK